jgi:transcriptional regulator with XRE-family HTH domain
VQIVDPQSIDWDGLPARLRTAIAVRKLSHRRFATAAGVSSQAASKWLNGGHISPERWSSVAEAAGLSVPELLGVPLETDSEPAPDVEPVAILRRLATISSQPLDRAVPDLMQLLRDAQQYAEAHDW